MARFAKGTSGNPGGRPAGLEQQLKKELAGDLPALLEVLREIALGKLSKKTGRRTVSKASPKDRRQAADSLLDRILGRARQSVEVSSDGPSLLSEILGLTPAQRARRAAELESKAGADDGPPST